MVQSSLSDILHVVSQGLLAPVIIVLLLFMVYALFCIGSVIAEYFTERKHFQVVMPKFLNSLMTAKQNEIPQVIEDSGLLNRQKEALLTVYDYRTLPGDALVALIKREVGEEEARYDRAVNRNNVAARVSPMIGLMGTLIPLGPGIEALGRSEVDALSSSLLVAFDTTVAGLVVAAVCLIVGKIRSSWYDNYLSALDAAMATMLEKIEAMRAAGEITTQEPTDYAFLFQQKVEARKGKGVQELPAKESEDAADEPVAQDLADEQPIAQRPAAEQPTATESAAGAVDEAVEELVADGSAIQPSQMSDPSFAPCKDSLAIDAEAQE